MSNCLGTTRSGDPCPVPARIGKSFCVNCSPDLEEQRAEWRSKGGRATAMAAEEAQPPTEPVNLWSLAGRMRVLENTLATTMLLRNSAARARAVGGLVRLASEMMTAQELVELEARLVELETQQQRETPW